MAFRVEISEPRYKIGRTTWGNAPKPSIFPHGKAGSRQVQTPLGLLYMHHVQALHYKTSRKLSYAGALPPGMLK